MLYIPFKSKVHVYWSTHFDWKKKPDDAMAYFQLEAYTNSVLIITLAWDWISNLWQTIKAKAPLLNCA